MKVDKYKREYHAATKNLKLAETQENNSKLDGSIPADQVRINLSELKNLLFILWLLPAFEDYRESWTWPEGERSRQEQIYWSTSRIESSKSKIHGRYERRKKQKLNQDHTLIVASFFRCLIVLNYLKEIVSWNIKNSWSIQRNVWISVLDCSKFQQIDLFIYTEKNMIDDCLNCFL